MRITKTLTISLPPQLARDTEHTAREEQCKKSDLVRGPCAFLYIWSGITSNTNRLNTNINPLRMQQ